MTPDQPAASLENEPKGPSNLRLRVIWGAIAAAGLFGCTFASPLTFGLFFAAVQAIMLKEFYRIMRAKEYRPAFWIGIVASLILFGIIHLWLGYAQYIHAAANRTFIATANVTVPIGEGALPEQQLVLTAWALGAIGLLALLLIIGLLLREMKLWPVYDNPFGNMAVTFWGLLYVSVPMALLQLLAFVQHYPQDLHRFEPRRVFLLIVLIWAADTGAYFAGKSLGRHKLAPSISPGKTWEGWAGGAVLTLVVGGLAGYFVPDITLAHRLVAAGVVAVFGPLGDLAESMLKRSAGVKDSGTFLPGHGGLLDRFDAFLLVLPVLALLQALAG